MKRPFIIVSFAAICLSLAVYWMWPEPVLEAGTLADKLVVYKAERTLQLWADGKIAKTYRISLGSHPEGHKCLRGDGRTPEGTYYINDKNPTSQFHLNLGISYPNDRDRKVSDDPGGDIKIHGLKNGLGAIGKLHRLLDWTNGCIAVTNHEIRELYDAVPIGTPIQLNP